MIGTTISAANFAKTSVSFLRDAVVAIAAGFALVGVLVLKRKRVQQLSRLFLRFQNLHMSTPASAITMAALRTFAKSA